MELSYDTLNDLIQHTNFDRDLFPDLNLNNPMLSNNDTEDPMTDFSDLFPNDDILLKGYAETSSNTGDAAFEFKLLPIGSPSQSICQSNTDLEIQDEYDFMEIFNDNSNQQQAEIQNSPTLKTAVGGDKNIQYQMFPNLFSASYGTMTVKQQPEANKRFRYNSDGARFLPNSRYDPMSIELPEFLKQIRLKQNQVLGVILTLATITDERNLEMYVHVNDLAYRVTNAVKIGYASVFVPIDFNEIQAGEKKFVRLSIIYKKCDEYTFDLIPFNTQTMFGTARNYASDNRRSIGVAAKGKQFKQDYNLLSYKIVFQLAVREENVIYISNVSCQTEDIHDSIAPTPTPTRSNKRKSSELISEDNNTSYSTRSKRLPITRVVA